MAGSPGGRKSLPRRSACAWHRSHLRVIVSEGSLLLRSCICHKEYSPSAGIYSGFPGPGWLLPTLLQSGAVTSISKAGFRHQPQGRTCHRECVGWHTVNFSW